MQGFSDYIVIRGILGNESDGKCGMHMETGV